MNFISKLLGLYKNRNQNLEKAFDLDITKFSSVKSFWEFITKEPRWYLTYSPHNIKNIDSYLTELEPLIVETTNRLREKMEFSYADYSKIANWDHFLIRKDMDASNTFKRDETITFKQFCPHCKNERGFSQRYPKAICRTCYSETTDNKGKPVEYFNTHALGHGCQGYYVGTEQKETYNSEICYINRIEYVAKEARFGGIVIQLKE